MKRFVKLTCVEEESINEGTVTEEGAHRCHIIKEAVPKGGVDEGDRLQLHVDEPSKDTTVSTCLLIQWQGRYFLRPLTCLCLCLTARNPGFYFFVLGVYINID